jgi:hypothetical protein
MTPASTMDRLGDIQHMVACVADGRKDEVLIDMARLLAAHYGRMVEALSAAEGRPVSAHNNKTLFLEGIDLWCRTYFSGAPEATGYRRTGNPRDIVVHAMTPWYEALALDNPAQYRPGRIESPPVYAGSQADATCLMLALCAAVDVTPVRLRFGLEGDTPRRVWGRVYADDRWYDSDVGDAGLALGDHLEFEGYEEIEVPL